MSICRRVFWGPGAGAPIVQDEGSAMNCSGTKFLQAGGLGSVVAVADRCGHRIKVNTCDEYGMPGAGSAETVSVGASLVGFAANVFDARPGNAAVELFGIGFGGAAGLGAKAIHPAAQLARNAGAALVSSAASSICPG